MTAIGRVRAEFGAGWRSFVRRRTAVFFTFFFPVLLIVIFGALVETDPTGGGLFAEPAGYYVPGYLAVVVLFTPLSRVGSTVARHREGNRFEKLATTPLTRAEWLAAHTLVNVVLVGVASAIVLALTVLLTGADLALGPFRLVALAMFVASAVALFCGLGAVIGSLAGSQDGVIAASNAIALPLLFLSNTFVTLEMLPRWFWPVRNFSPLTYFATGVRNLTYWDQSPIPLSPVIVHNYWVTHLAVLSVLAVLFFAAGAYALPRTD